MPLFFVLLTVASMAQTQVTGRITDANGAGLAGVTVTVKGTSTATATNENGEFTIPVPANGRILVFSSVGYGTREENINGRSSINTTLQTSGQNLNEVVVVAYGTRRRGDLTSSVTQVTSKDFQKGFQPSAEQLIQGKVAGVQMTNGGGQAGGGSRIRIRGGSSLTASNDPLVVIDNVPVEGNGVSGTGNLLSTINPNDIESMTVLKDASATALYGSRASNGVIIIVTKKGSRGKVKFNFNTTNSISKISKFAPVLTGDDIRSIIGQNAGATGDSTWYKLLGTANTDWQREIYRTAFATDNNLSASGQVKWLPFRISGGYTRQEGVLRKNQFDRLSAALNLSPKFLNDHLSVIVNGKFANIKNNFSDEGAIGTATYYDPTQPVYATASKNSLAGYYQFLQTSTTSPLGFEPKSLAPANPLSMIDLRDNTSTVNRFIGNVQVDYSLHWFPDLHLIANAGGDFTTGQGHNNVDSMAFASFSYGGSRYKYKQGRADKLLDLSMFYSKDIKTLKTKVDVLLLHSYQDNTIKVYNNPSFSYRAIADRSNPAAGDTIPNSKPNPENVRFDDHYRLESWLSRVNFSIMDKYLLSASVRRDASSKLSPSGRVDYFPAVSGAWRLKQEFFNNVRALSDLKLRASYGITGQQGGIDYYSYLVRYTASNSSAQYQLGDTYYTMYRPEAYNKNLKWERTRTFNLGLDFGFLNNRLSGSFDYFRRNTTDLLLRVPVAPGANFSNFIVKNVASMTGEGLELAINSTPVRTSNFSWDFNFNATWQKRRITGLQDYPDPNFKGIDVSGIGIATGNTIGKLQVDQSPYAFYVYKQVYDKDGKPLEGVFEDLNRDGVVDNNDRRLFKKPDADFLVGFATQVNYKKFFAGATAHGQIGNYMYNQYAAGGVLASIKNPIGIVGNVSPSFIETGFQNNSNNQFMSDYYIQNASFLRIDNINLGYDLGRIISNRTNLRVSASIQNVAVITNYKGLDPEVSSDSGIDGNIYPRPRVYTLSFNLDF
ncbi:TonB-dependent receptor [Flaviaesturariibacter terrae]